MSRDLVEGAKSNHTFGISVPYLPIQYTRFMVLRRRLRVVTWWKFYNGRFSSKIFCSKNDVFGGLWGENFEFSRCDPARKSIPAETRCLVQRWRRYSQKCVLQSLARNPQPKNLKKNLWTLYFTPVPGRPYWADFFTIFGVWSRTPDVINRTKFQVDCARG